MTFILNMKPLFVADFGQ